MQSITLPWPLSKPQTLCTLKRKGGQALPGPGCLRLPLFEEKKWCREIESWCAVHLIQKPTSARNLLGGKSEFVLLNVMFCLSKSFQLGRQSPGRKSNLEPLSHFTRGSESHEKFGGTAGKQASQRSWLLILLLSFVRWETQISLTITACVCAGMGHAHQHCDILVTLKSTMEPK